MSPPLAPVRTEQQWLDLVRSRILRGESAYAEALLTDALRAFPGSFELRRILANSHRQARRLPEAEALLRELLRENPGDTGSAFALSQLLIEQSRTAATAQVMRTCFDASPRDPDHAIRAIELLDEIERKTDAAAIAEQAIAATPADLRLYAYAGMLQLQLGDFELARRHYLHVMQQSTQACEWGAPLGLASAQRYRDPNHPDFALLRTNLQRTDLSHKARSGLLFALGKARDDVGDYAQAAGYFGQANALAHDLTRWPRKDWRRAVEARLAAPPMLQRSGSTNDFLPIFIVGMPRSGTTLLAELLSRHPQVCNRGELPWIARLAQQPELAGAPGETALQRAATSYRTRTMQDDSGDACWFIDKQPLNFRYLDLMLAMFPHAKVVHCRRNPRDTALSLWMQSFREDVQGYACDFANIAMVMRDEEKLMSRWRDLYPQSIRTVHYEDVVMTTSDTICALAAWIGFPATRPFEQDAPSGHAGAISTASLWQARQPINTRSIGRWQHYASHVSGLLRFPAESGAALVNGGMPSAFRNGSSRDP